VSEGTGEVATEVKPEGKLLYQKDGHIARITFDNRPAHNALTMQMWHDLADACTDVAKDKDIRVVTMRGAGGKSFISGTDIAGFLKFGEGADGVRYERDMDRCIGTVEAIPQPTLAIVEGWAVGGGLAISFACDFRIATPTAKFGSPIANTIGNCLSMKGYTRLVANAGVAMAKRIVIYGEMPTAADLKALGLVLDVAEPEALEAKITEVVDRLASMAPLTVHTTKEAIRRLLYVNQPDLEDMIEMVYGSEDFRNGVRNFVEKKPQNWVGR
jgi:enoyl-CoA hydratase/carnithine racemase